MSSMTLVDDFENSFQACLSSLTNPNGNQIHDSEETKTSVELTIQRFLDVAHQMECFFLQKRLLLSVQKPDLILTEDCGELKNEIARKDQILQKYYDKLQLWQNILNDTVAMGTAPPNLQRQTSIMSQSGSAPTTPSQPPPMGPLSGASMPQSSHQQMRHQTPVPVPNQTHMMSPLQSQMNSPMTPPQVNPMSMPSGAGPSMISMQSGGMMPPPPPQSGQTSAPMMNQMGQGQAQMQQFMTQQPHGGLQGPLAYLERTTSNIGLPDPRR